MDVLRSVLQSSGPTKIDIIAVKSSYGRQLEDSGVRWTPQTRIIYSPGSTKKVAWEHGINYVLSGKLDTDYIALCDPFFIAEPNMFGSIVPQTNFRMYVPYSDQYGEEKAEKYGKLLQNNAGGNFLLLSRQSCYNFKTLPEFLDSYCLDYFVIDQLAMYGYTAHKIPNCYVKAIQKTPLGMKERKILADDMNAYAAWLKSKKGGGYNEIIGKRIANATADYCPEENCD